MVVDVGGRLDEALHHIEFGVLARRKEGGAAVRQADNVRHRAGLEERANDPRLAYLRRHRERAARNPEYVEVVELRLVGQENIDALRASLGTRVRWVNGQRQGLRWQGLRHEGDVRGPP